MAENKTRIKPLVTLGIMMVFMLACIEFKGCGKSKEENLLDYKATTFAQLWTQTAQALRPMMYPLFFKGSGTHTRTCTQNSAITFFVADSKSCRVSVEFPAACSGPLAESNGLNFTFHGYVTERDKEPSFCELTTCNAGDASGTVYFNQMEMVGNSTLKCANGSIVEFGPLDRQEGSAGP